MIQIEPWMVRTALVIGTLFVLDGALYVLDVWLERRQRKEPRAQAVTGFPPYRAPNRPASAESLEHQIRIRIQIAPTGPLIH